MTKQKTAARGYLFALAAGILWGASGTFAQFLFQQRGLSAEWLVSVRLMISGSILLALSLVKKDRDLVTIWQSRKNAVALLLFSIFGMLGVQYTFFAAIRQSNAAIATILQSLGPVMIALYLIGRERRFPGKIQVLAILLAISGTLLLVTHGKLDGLAVSTPGLLWGLGSALAIAFYSLQPARLLKSYSTTTIIGYGMLIGGLALAILARPWNVPGSWDLFTYLSAAFVILPGSVVAFYLYMSAVKIQGAQTSSLLASSEPVAAAYLAVIWLRVPYSLSDLAGTACILVTIYLLTAGSSKSRSKQKTPSAVNTP